MSAETLHLHVEVVPTVLFATNQDLYHSGKFCGSLFCFNRYVSVGGAYDSLYLCRLVSVGEIVLNELIGCGDSDCSYLVKCKHTEPELIVTL